MKKFVGLFVAVLTISSIAQANSAAKIHVSSAWTNQRGSTLYIDHVGSNGQRIGMYVNRAPGYQCQHVPYPVTGWIYGSAITCTTMWQSPKESCHSITSWTGFYDQGQIQTLWQLVINGSSSTSQIVQGTDTFTPDHMKENKALLMEN